MGKAEPIICHFRKDVRERTQPRTRSYRIIDTHSYPLKRFVKVKFVTATVQRANGDFLLLHCLTIHTTTLPKV